MKKLLFFTIKLLLFVSIICFILLWLLYIYFSKNLPNIEHVINNSNNSSIIDILYSNNLNKIKTYNNIGIDTIEYNEIPENLINALIATEDRKFFSHNGINYISILRATIVNFRKKYLSQGGSTITQQLAKMLLNDNSKTFKRKFKELILTKQLEKKLTKENILSLYLTKSYFGAGKYGIKDASKFYFNKNPKDLELEECAMLVGLLKAPTKYNPTNNQDITKKRTTQVILNMQKAGFINDKDILSYIIPDLNLNNIQHAQTNNQSYYFSDWVYNQLSNIIDINNGHKISVFTTLDYNIQNTMISVINNFITNNKTKINDSQLAVLIMNKDGRILAMTGGKDYNISQFNRAIQAKRQTGSLFKLFVYLTGFENGLKINDVFIDEPIKIANWYPENNNSQYYGKITVKDAFALSSNSVAVQIADYFGINNIIETANKLGIINDFKNDLTITLGSQESNLLDMVTAYATIVNDGIPIFPYTIKHITSDGNIIYKRQITNKKAIFSQKAIENMQYLLFNVIENGTGKKAKIDSLIEKTKVYNMLYNDNKFFIGGKTGSTQKNIDAWFIGFANDIIIGIWFGNDNNTPTNKIMGGNLPAMLWKEIAENIIY